MAFTTRSYTYPTLDDAKVAFHAINNWMRLYNVDAFLQVLVVESIETPVLLLGVSDKDADRCIHKIKPEDWNSGTPFVVDVELVMAAEARHTLNKTGHDFSEGAIDLLDTYDTPIELLADGKIADDSESV